MLSFVLKVLLLSGAIAGAIVLAGIPIQTLRPNAAIAIVAVILPVAVMAVALAWRSRVAP